MEEVITAQGHVVHTVEVDVGVHETVIASHLKGREIDSKQRLQLNPLGAVAAPNVAVDEVLGVVKGSTEFPGVDVLLES